MARADSSGGEHELKNQIKIFGRVWIFLEVFGRSGLLWTFGLRSASNALVEEVRLTEPNYTCSEEKRKAPKISNAIFYHTPDPKGSVDYIFVSILKKLASFCFGPPTGNRLA